eukprot:GFKZ01000191.1.p1 GENE.GFKZ01000191.1~~GFKZ01000191.1.p1  ORF type:complete len:374 (+),score=50.37 GFKZ01000191.1:420-1541(+)
MPNSVYFNHLFEEVEGLAPDPSHPTSLLPSNSHPHINPSLDNQPPQEGSPWQPEAFQLPEEHEEDQEEEEEEDEDDPPKPQQEPMAGKRRKQELHRRHSKRYRDNLGELFQSLEQLLPKVVPGCKLKTKSQIIANSVQAVKSLRAEVSSLEMQYVLSSPANRTKWVEETVRKATGFQDVAEPFMRLLVGMQRWKHSELWCRYEAAILPDGRLAGGPVSAPTNTVNDIVPSKGGFYLKLERVASAHDITATAVPEEYKVFSKLSQMVTFTSGDDSLVGRIASSLSPEWIDLTDPESCRGFKRSVSAKRCGFTVCFAVPFLVRGHVFATILFYDDSNRSDIGPDISIAQDLSSSLGNCYGASVTQKPGITTSTDK